MTDEEIKTKASTIARTVILVVALANQILAILGRDTIPLAENDVYQFATIGLTIGSSVWSWWKNNSFTRNAKRADIYLGELRKKEENNV